MKKLKLSQALLGYDLYAKARHLSDHTILDYQNTFTRFQTWLGDQDPIMADITQEMVCQFMADQKRVSNKTLLNYHVGLSALWTWALGEGIVEDHVIHRVPRPKPEKRSVVPFEEHEIKAMLSALGRSRVYQRQGYRASDHSLPNAERNRAIILLLLDTGIRASELCGAVISDINLRNRNLRVFGKGAIERTIPFSATTGQAIWRYLSTREGYTLADPLFVNSMGRSLDRTQLFHLLDTIADRAQVQDCNVHKFRHTFAINYLRNGGNPYSLQVMLGHSAMDMVKRYLKIADADLERFHRRASPVDNWRL